MAEKIALVPVPLLDLMPWLIRVKTPKTDRMNVYTLEGALAGCAGYAVTCAGQTVGAVAIRHDQIAWVAAAVAKHKKSLAAELLSEIGKLCNGRVRFRTERAGLVSVAMRAGWRAISSDGVGVVIGLE